MDQSKLIYISFLLISLVSCGSQSTNTTTGTGGTSTTYTYSDVQPLFATYCVACHSKQLAQGGVQLDSLAGIKASRSGSKDDISSGKMPKNSSISSATDKQKLIDYLTSGSDL